MAARKGSGLGVSCAKAAVAEMKRQNAAAQARYILMFHLALIVGGKKRDSIGKSATAHPAPDGTVRPVPGLRETPRSRVRGRPAFPAVLPAGNERGRRAHLPKCGRPDNHEASGSLRENSCRYAGAGRRRRI